MISPGKPARGSDRPNNNLLKRLSETLQTEVKGFGIDITLVEPNGFATDWSGASAIQTTPLAVYQPVRDAFAAASAELAWRPPVGVPARPAAPHGLMRRTD